MADEVNFTDLIKRVRAGDDEAAAELVRRYEPAVRRAIRYRLTDPRLRRVYDSMDICQAVLASFFVRTAAGQYELDTPEQLQKLLATMARNKLAKQAHQQQAARRDHRRQTGQPLEEQNLAGAGPTPSRQAAARELLQKLHEKLSPDERQLMELRNQGHEWAEIATLVGGTPEALRKRLARAVEQAAQDLHLDDAADF